MGGEQQAIEAYKLEVGGVPEVGVAVQRSLEQRPPGARKRRRAGGATAGHLCLPTAASASLAAARFREKRRWVRINGPDLFDSCGVGPTRQ